MKKRKGRITKKLVQATEDKPFAFPTIEHKAEVDDSPWDAEGLTIRQLRFVEALVGEAGGNATKAAEIAGYNGENRQILAVTASECLRKPKVREAIARRMARGNLSGEWIREMTAALAASNMGSFMSLDAEGKPEINWREAERLGAFVQIRKYKEKGFKVDDKIEVVERTIETHNPAPYLQLLARLQGMLQDAPAVGVTINVNQVSDDELVRIATRGGNRVAETAASTPEPGRISDGDQ